MKRAPAEVLRELGPFPGASRVNGVTFDGQHLWLASGERLNAVDPDTGEVVRTLDVTADAGTAFDGRHLYQLAGDHIQKIDPASGQVLATLPAPGEECSGLAWAEGFLWVGQYRSRCIHQVDPASGARVRTLQSNRFVTGITWVEGELWHGTWEEEQSELRQIDPQTGEVLQALALPPGKVVSGLESDGADQLFAGGGTSGRVRVVRRPRQRR